MLPAPMDRTIDCRHDPLCYTQFGINRRRTPFQLWTNNRQLKPRSSHRRAVWRNFSEYLWLNGHKFIESWLYRFKCVSLFLAMKIHMSPETSDMLHKHGSFNTEARGGIQVKVPGWSIISKPCGAHLRQWSGLSLVQLIYRIIYLLNMNWCYSSYKEIS